MAERFGGSRRDFHRLAGLASLGAALGPWRSASAQTLESATLDEVKAAAAKEGTFVWYDSIPPENMKLLIDTFHADHPEIRLQYIEVAATARTARVIQESNAGGPTADYLTHNGQAIMGLSKTGMVRAIDWKALGLETSPRRTPNPFMIYSHGAAYTTIYNTTKVADGDAPQTFDALLDPRWKGRIALWAQPSGPLTLLPEWGESKTTDFVTRLAAQTPRIYRTPFAAAEAVTSGECYIGALLPHNTVWETVDKGAPVKILLPEPVGVSSLYAFLPKFGKNPNAAKLFVSWLTTRKGALVLEKASGRGNLLVPETRLATLLAGKKLSWEDPLKLMDDSDQIIALGERYSKMLQGR